MVNIELTEDGDLEDLAGVQSVREVCVIEHRYEVPVCTL